MGADGFRVGVSRDFLAPDGRRNLWGDIGLGRLEAAGVSWEYLPVDVARFAPEHLEPYDAVLFAAPAVTAESFADGVDRPVLLARFGVGYDSVDLDACTAHDVAVTITPDGARGPVATAALTLLLAALQNLVLKDRLVREHRWDERVNHMGLGLTGRTVGLLGVGNTGAELVQLLAPFRVKLIGHDPFCPAQRAKELGVQLVDRDQLAEQSDAVVVMAALTEQTHHLVDEEFLRRMHPDAVLVNVARGPIVDEPALVRALRSGRLRAAALDVFEQEPPTSGIERLDNIILAPHSIAWTAQMSHGNGSSCVDAILAVARDEDPRYVVNREVLQRPGFLTRRSGRACTYGSR